MLEEKNSNVSFFLGIGGNFGSVEELLFMEYTLSLVELCLSASHVLQWA